MQRTLLLILVACIAGAVAAAKAQSPPPAESSQLDFWVGEWKCSGQSYGPNGQVQQTKATNSIKRILGGHVLWETFESQGFHGTSMSVYVPALKTWRQTWVDDSGSYLAFRGGKEGGKIVLSTDVTPKGNVARMVFHNITREAFDWDWEKSSDHGKTWALAWHLHYTRV